MQVNVGATWETARGSRTYELALDMDDLREFLGDEKVDAMSRKEILASLNKRAEILVVAYVAEQGGMSQEFAANRIKELTQ